MPDKDWRRVPGWECRRGPRLALGDRRQFLRVQQIGGFSAWYEEGEIFNAPPYDQSTLDTYARTIAEKAKAEERDRCASVCDDEARIRQEAARKHPEGSDSRDRCDAAARAAINCAKGIRNGEVVDVIRKCEDPTVQSCDNSR